MEACHCSHANVPCRLADTDHACPPPAPSPHTTSALATAPLRTATSSRGREASNDPPCSPIIWGWNQKGALGPQERNPLLSPAAPPAERPDDGPTPGACPSAKPTARTRSLSPMYPKAEVFVQLLHLPRGQGKTFLLLHLVLKHRAPALGPSGSFWPTLRQSEI